MSRMLHMMAGAALTAGLVCGCALFSNPVEITPAPVSGVSVVAKDRESLRKAIMVAASRRRWVPNAVTDSLVRCTLVQRQYRAEIDVVLDGERSYSITCAYCNIPEAKYRQWIDNLQREIALQAVRVK